MSNLKDVTHLSKAGRFALARQALQQRESQIKLQLDRRTRQQLFGLIAAADLTISIL